jgi:hypothetical protein
MKANGSLIPLLVSEPIIATIGKDSTAVANVGEVTVKTEA